MKTAGFQTTKMEFIGTIAGYLWMPMCPAYKHVKKRISREDKPFSLAWPGTFRELLESVSMEEDGDFSSSRFVDAYLRITRIGKSSAGPVSRVVCVDLNRTDTDRLAFALLTAALGRVNWRELAEEWLACARE